MATNADITGITREITSNTMITSDTVLSATPTTPIIKITTNIILSTSDVATDSALISTLTARNSFESSVILTTGPTTSNRFESRTIFTTTDFTPLADARQQQNDDSGSNNAGIIAGCIVAFVVFIVVICVIIFLILYCIKKKKGEYLRCIQQLYNHLCAYVWLSVVSIHGWSDYCSYVQWCHCIYTVDFVVQLS